MDIFYMFFTPNTFTYIYGTSVPLKKVSDDETPEVCDEWKEICKRCILPQISKFLQNNSRK